MSTLSYTPDADVKVHEEGAIRLLCAPFQSHETGLPEWLKNSADAYARADLAESHRVVLLVFDSGRARSTPSIAVLDLVGMTSTAIEESFRVWADPEAATRGARGVPVQGGHGNGGKCYMTQMFEHHAEIFTVRERKASRYGVSAGSVRFGYIPDRSRGRDQATTDIRTAIDQALSPLRCSIDLLPQGVQEACRAAEGFTLITGVGPKGYENRIPSKQILQALLEHPQMVQTLALCRVYVVVNGTLFAEGQPLALPQIPPMEGAETPREIRIPQLLRDPITSEKVTTSNESDGPGSLILRTSDKSMRWGRKGRHNIIYRAGTGYIGFVPVVELDVQSTYRDRIYGECNLAVLERYKTNERRRLAESPLTRALEQWISEQIEVYAKEFEARDRRRYQTEEKDALSRMNDALDQWKNRFLDDLLRGLWGPGSSGPNPEPRPPLPSGKPVRIELTLSHPRAGLGVSFRPTLRFYDDGGRQVRPLPFRWISEDTNVAMVDDDLMVINTFAYGKTKIWAETENGRVRSNRVDLNVVRLLHIEIAPAEVSVAMHSRTGLRAACKLASDEETSDIYLVWTESNPAVARVSAAGLVFGFGIGSTQVVAGDDHCLASTPAVVTVIPSEGKGTGDRRGKGFPIVRISEVQPDPETGEEVTLSREDPPVYQRPEDVDRNIWWINSASPLARLFLSDGKGYGFQSREFRMYMIERYAEIMIQIAFTHGPGDQDSLTVNDWLLKWGEQSSQIQLAAADALADFIDSGDLPGLAA